uniref:Uncharacterized protein n=1 Tax=viral metagenome TaxID=1070528 RepID=A0A6C0F5K4_9ZZZZ|tara:strand:+ start:20502 stop:21065 length:564 start_codon:yes stop_codon:yes gene_type:complete
MSISYTPINEAWQLPKFKPNKIHAPNLFTQKETHQKILKSSGQTLHNSIPVGASHYTSSPFELKKTDELIPQNSISDNQIDDNSIPDTQLNDSMPDIQVDDSISDTQIDDSTSKQIKIKDSQVLEYIRPYTDEYLTELVQSSLKEKFEKKTVEMFTNKISIPINDDKLKTISVILILIFMINYVIRS